MTITTLPMSLQGATPIPPTQLLANLLAAAAALSPDYTANLPGTLIEDISSTDVPAMAQIDQARVDAINSITPYSANPFVLAQMGLLLGIPKGLPTNTNCFVVFTGTAGYYIPSGFLVSDGQNSYTVQNGGAIQANGTSQPLYVVAVNPGSFAVPIGTIIQIASSVPSPYTLTVTNQVAGIPGAAAESVQSYRARIMQAQASAAQGTPAFILSNLQNINGVVARLTTILQTSQGWKVICGGGDPYAVAGAIYESVLDLSNIVGSATASRNINVSLIDSPNIYNVIYVNPVQQIIGVSVTWNTVLPNFAYATQVNQLGQTAILNYINSTGVGQPLNINALTDAFQNGVQSVLSVNMLTTLNFSITVNGNTVTPNAGTQLITTDAESYFFANASGVTVVQ